MKWPFNASQSRSLPRFVWRNADLFNMLVRPEELFSSAIDDCSITILWLHFPLPVVIVNSHRLNTAQHSVALNNTVIILITAYRHQLPCRAYSICLWLFLNRGLGCLMVFTMPVSPASSFVFSFPCNYWNFCESIANAPIPFPETLFFLMDKCNWIDLYLFRFQ